MLAALAAVVADFPGVWVPIRVQWLAQCHLAENTRLRGRILSNWRSVCPVTRWRWQASRRRAQLQKVTPAAGRESYLGAPRIKPCMQMGRQPAVACCCDQLPSAHDASSDLKLRRLHVAAWRLQVGPATSRHRPDSSVTHAQHGAPPAAVPWQGERLSLPGIILLLCMQLGRCGMYTCCCMKSGRRAAAAADGAGAFLSSFALPAVLCAAAGCAWLRGRPAAAAV